VEPPKVVSEPPAKCLRSELCSADLQIGVNGVEDPQDAELELGTPTTEDLDFA
jgi:hypothetical protein